VQVFVEFDRDSIGLEIPRAGIDPRLRVDAAECSVDIEDWRPCADEKP
jgi:hypothetical protein